LIYTAQKVVNITETGSKMNIENLDAVMCVFCEGFVADKIDYSNGTQYCVPCNEYKGITTVREYIAEYGNVLVTA
jgi:hypothetical protein